MKTAAFENISLSVFPTVYEPAEDSFLLAKVAAGLQGKILEIGCGSGICSIAACLGKQRAATEGCSIAAAKGFEGSRVAAKASGKNIVIGVDINAAAVSCSKENARANNAKNCAFFVSDLFAKVKKGEKFDFILFNPPYLPTSSDEKLQNPQENAAYDGGKSGMKTISKFLKEAPEFLKDMGEIFIVATSLGDVDAKISKLAGKMGFSAKEISCEKFFFEKICVLRLSRNKKKE